MHVNEDRRKHDLLYILQNFIMPAIIAVLSAYMSVKITISALEIDILYLKRDLQTQQILLEQVRENQAELRARKVWMTTKDIIDANQSAELQKLWHKLENR